MYNIYKSNINYNSPYIYARMVYVYREKDMKKNIANLVEHAEVSEKMIERYLVERVKSIGGVCLKYSNAGMVGYPDRVALFPGGQTYWIELKSKGKKLSKVQSIRKAELEKLGHPVLVIDSKNSVDEFINLWEDKQ